MDRWIALFRGINVGGKNRLPMKDLVTDLQDLKLKNVETYIQSGNVVFQSRRRDRTKLAAGIQEQVRTRRGVDAKVLLLSEDELLNAIAANPYPEAEQEPKTLHLYFLEDAAAEGSATALKSICSDSERYELRDRLIYLHAPDGIGKSKLVANIERTVGTSATGRNWRTVLALQERLDGQASK